MNDLRVTFVSGPEGGYRALLADAAGSSVGPVEVLFTPFLSEEDYENLRWYLEDYMDLPDGGAVVRARRVERDLDAWGRKFYDELFSNEDSKQLLKALLASPEPRELTIASRDAALLRLPWELLADEAGSLAPRVSIRRQLEETPDVTAPRPAELPLRILYIVSRPADAGFLDPRLTAKAMFDAVDPLGGAVRVDFCRPPTLARMEELLREAKQGGDSYDLVHFDGHGTFLPHAQIGALLFEKADDGSGAAAQDLVPADRLGEIFASYQIPLVVLEACRSATVGKAAVFRSVAPRLIQAGVGSVLSMGHAVHVEAARLLLDRFYRELVRGTTIGHAVAEARRALNTTRARWIETGPRGRTVELRDWFLPHLYQRALDEPLFPPDAASKQSVREYDLFLSHQYNDSVRVEALAQEFSEKHGLRVWLDKWECGPGNLEKQCEAGIASSRFTVVAGSQTALRSKWVQWEIDRHNALNPEGDRLLPIKLEVLDLPPELDALLWVDFTDPAKDAEQAALLGRLIRGADAEDARRRRHFRAPASREGNEPGPFPPPPPYGFQGRARELYDLERLFRRTRGLVLHAMGGMGKTALATEAAHWWARSGLFRDGACFLSFEQFASADRAVQLLGTYLDGPNFDQLPAREQRRRSIELFRDKEVLFVWDNFESALPQFADEPAASPYTDDERHRLGELFRDLTAGPGNGCLLVTCRPGETGLPGAEGYELSGLARPDSLWLLASILKRDGLALGVPRFARDRIDPLLGDLADHPLSLELVGPHLRTLTPEEIRADFGRLLEKFQQEAPEGRNQSLLASLEFSRKHLSLAAREALPWLGLFRGGVHEDTFLDISQIVPKSWELIRRELEDVALVRVWSDTRIEGRPFLRFHPTLAAAAAEDRLAKSPAVRKRYVFAYGALMLGLDKALRGSQSRVALEILGREEANYRTAVQWAVADQEFRIAASLGNTFRLYLQRLGRLRERDIWVEWVKDVVSEGGFTEEAANCEREYACIRFNQGDVKGAVNELEKLIERLKEATEFDPAFQLALAVGTLGQLLDNAGTSAQATPILQSAVNRWENLVERAGGAPWEQLLSTSELGKATNELGNLSNAMGDLASALCDIGQHDEALALAEKCVEIHKRLDHQREVAADLGRCAKILMEAGHLKEADSRYDRALAAARVAGDKELEGAFLQHQGGLAYFRNQSDRAIRLYQQALQIFQEENDLQAVMLTYNLLGAVEQNVGRLGEARAWFMKSRAMAAQLKDQVGLGQAEQNLGIIYQEEGEAVRKCGDELSAKRLFEEARSSVEKSLQVWQAQKNRPYEAASSTQLAQIQLRLGNLALAERYAHQGRCIYESLDLKEAWKSYNTLSEIAKARGDVPAVTKWTLKRDKLRRELRTRVGGGGGLAVDILRVLQGLTISCVQAGSEKSALGPADEDTLAQLDQLPAPLPALAGYLRDLAVGRTTTIPDGLPAELREWLESLATAQ